MDIIFQELVRQIARENEIEVKILSEGYVLELTKNDKVRHIADAYFDLNNHASRNYYARQICNL